VTKKPRKSGVMHEQLDKIMTKCLKTGLLIHPPNSQHLQLTSFKLGRLEKKQTRKVERAKFSFH
jgi:hypothetical protein